jgi:hypothetical protein
LLRLHASRRFGKRPSRNLLETLTILGLPQKRPLKLARFCVALFAYIFAASRKGCQLPA